jgi:hypothetical protein
MMKAFKFIKTDMKSGEGNVTWKLNEWNTHEGELNSLVMGDDTNDNQRGMIE